MGIVKVLIGLFISVFLRKWYLNVDMKNEEELIIWEVESVLVCEVLEIGRGLLCLRI